MTAVPMTAVPMTAVPSVMYEADVGVSDETTDKDFYRVLLNLTMQVEEEKKVVLTASASPRYSCWAGKFAGGEHLYHVSVMFNTTQVSNDVGEDAAYYLYELLHRHFDQYVVKVFRVQADCVVIK
jgi:hypothetical protein